jgi:acyl carrier protein
MNQDEVLNWIATVFEEGGPVHPGTSRDEIRGWDSMGMLTLMAGLDEKFQIQLDGDDVQNMRKVDDILALLRKSGALAS